MCKTFSILLTLDNTERLMSGEIYWPGNVCVGDGAQHHQDRDRVEEAVATKWPPVQMRDGASAQRTHGDHEHYIEYRWTNYSRYTCKTLFYSLRDNILHILLILDMLQINCCMQRNIMLFSKYKKKKSQKDKVLLVTRYYLIHSCVSWSLKIKHTIKLWTYVEKP